MKILVIDPSTHGRTQLEHLLADASDIEVVWSSAGGSDPAAAIGPSAPDCLIIDIDIPGRSGIDILHAIRASYPRLPVIVLTNASTPQHRKRCTEAGADGFLDKSTEFLRLPAMVRAIGELNRETPAIPPGPGTPGRG